MNSSKIISGWFQIVKSFVRLVPSTHSTTYWKVLPKSDIHNLFLMFYAFRVTYQVPLYSHLPSWKETPSVSLIYPRVQLNPSIECCSLRLISQRVLSIRVICRKRLRLRREWARRGSLSDGRRLIKPRRPHEKPTRDPEDPFPTLCIRYVWCSAGDKGRADPEVGTILTRGDKELRINFISARSAN